MPYVIYDVDELGPVVIERHTVKPVATLTDAEMLSLGRIRGLRFQLLMASALGALLDKLEPAFMKVAESKLDRRLSELQSSEWTMQEGEADVVGPL